MHTKAPACKTSQFTYSVAELSLEPKSLFSQFSVLPVLPLQVVMMGEP